MPRRWSSAAPARRQASAPSRRSRPTLPITSRIRSRRRKRASANALPKRQPSRPTAAVQSGRPASRARCSSALPRAHPIATKWPRRPSARAVWTSHFCPPPQCGIESSSPTRSGADVSGTRTLLTCAREARTRGRSEAAASFGRARLLSCAALDTALARLGRSAPGGRALSPDLPGGLAAERNHARREPLRRASGRGELVRSGTALGSGRLSRSRRGAPLARRARDTRRDPAPAALVRLVPADARQGALREQASEELGPHRVLAARVPGRALRARDPGRARRGELDRGADPEPYAPPVTPDGRLLPPAGLARAVAPRPGRAERAPVAGDRTLRVGAAAGARSRLLRGALRGALCAAARRLPAALRIRGPGGGRRRARAPPGATASAQRRLARAADRRRDRHPREDRRRSARRARLSLARAAAVGTTFEHRPAQRAAGERSRARASAAGVADRPRPAQRAAGERSRARASAAGVVDRPRPAQRAAGERSRS